MTKAQQIEKLRSRSEIVYRDGQLLDYTLYGDKKNKRYTPRPRYESDSLNEVQKFLYKRALKGLAVYNRHEIRELAPAEKSKVVRLYSRTQRELTMWKHKLTIEATDEILALLPNSRLAKSLLGYDCLNVSTDNNLSFRDLGITKEDIIARLHSVGILPDNFYKIHV